jgi:hypothetical protein
MKRLLAAFLGFSVSLVSTTTGKAQISQKNFEIDASKPYVYIQFDHLGKRKSADDFGSTNGLWLRLVNNCRIAIKVGALDWGTRDPGAALNFEVVPNGGWNAPDSEQRKMMPHGLSADIGTLVTIRPGGDLLFSVPAESVSKHWYIQVRFDFDLPTQKSIKGTLPGHYEPYSVVDFTWYNIPEAQRPSSSENTDTEPPPLSMPIESVPKAPY